MVKGNESQWGSLSCGCHPNCGVGTALMINKETKEWAPVSALPGCAAGLTADVTRHHRRRSRQEFLPTS